MTPSGDSHTVQIRLVSFGERKIHVIKQVRAITGLGLKESKALVEALGVIQKVGSLEAAQKVKAKLESAGATVVVEPSVEAGPKPGAEADGFEVHGVVKADGQPAAGLLVRAFDRDLRSEQRLGESGTDPDGRYRIVYTPEQFRRAEKHRADLLLRVFNDVGTPLAATPGDTHFNAAPVARIDLEVGADEPREASEFERLDSLLSPALDGLQPSDLTAEDVAFLVEESEINELPETFPAGSDSVRFFAQAARLSNQTRVDATAFYGWAREGQGLGSDDAGTRIDLKILAATKGDTLRAELAAAIEKNIVPARLRDEIPAILRRLQASLAEDGVSKPLVLKGRITDRESGRPASGLTIRVLEEQDGRETTLAATGSHGRFELTLPGDAAGSALVVEGPAGEELAREEVTASGAEFSIEVEIPRPEPPASPGGQEQLSDITDLVPDDLGRKLAAEGAVNLADVRALAGRGELEDMAAEFGEEPLRLLQAHANLSIVTADPEVRTVMIRSGYASPADIVEAPIEKFLSATEGSLGSETALGLAHTARAAVSFLDSGAVGALVEHARTGRGSFPRPEIGPDFIADLLGPKPCQCGCTHALSPAAYLADLLDYVTTHLDLEGADRLTLQFLHERFHQPFDQLPASCRFVKEEVRQVRVCVEVLRGFLASSPPSGEAAGALTEAERSYRVETYRRLLEQLGTDPDEVRDAINDEPTRNQLADRLGIAASHLESGALFFEPDRVTESDLETMFGYRATTNALAELPEAAVLSWQRDEQSSRWLEADHSDPESGPPLVDPDLVEPADLTGTAGVYPALRARRRFVESVSARVAARSRDLGGLDEILRDELQTDRDELKEKSETAGSSAVSGYLSSTGLSRAALDLVSRVIVRLEGGSTLSDSDWADVYAIAVEAQKRQQHADWRREEAAAGIVLSPDFFVTHRRDFSALLDTEPALRWRVDVKRRREWERALKSRAQRLESLTEGLERGVSEVEEAMLPVLRDALLEASSSPGESLDEKAEWITGQLQIDARMGGCSVTTRVAQAIETIQSLVYSVRTGQLDARLAPIAPLPASFDQDWQWLGSYATWKAATSVFLYPENVLYPTLRRGKTPGFRDLIATVRDSPQLSPGQARVAAGEYSDYFADICSLELQASCLAETGLDGNDEFPAQAELVFLFAKGGRTGRIYWSAYDLEQGFETAQARWRLVPQLPAYSDILGATPFSQGWGNRSVCVFAKVSGSSYDAAELHLLKFDLANLNWDPAGLRPLKLPSAERSFHAVVVQRSKSQADTPPKLVIYDYHELYVGELNVEATAWDASQDWEPFYSRGGTVQVEFVLPPGHEEAGTVVELEVPLNLTVFENVPLDENGSPLELYSPFPVAAHQSGSSEFKVLFFNQVEELPLFVGRYHRNSSAHRRINWSAHLDTDVGEIWFVSPTVRTPSKVRVEIERVLWDAAAAAEIVGATAREVFWLDDEGEGFRQSLSGGVARQGPAGIGAIPPSNCKDSALPYQTDGGVPGPFLGNLSQSGMRRKASLAPLAVEHFEISEETPPDDRLSGITMAYWANLGNRVGQRIPRAHLDYLAEAYYFVPVYLALELQRAGLFESALDWFRQIFDFGANEPGSRQIFDHALLQYEATFSEDLSRADDWFRDPLNPHAIASTRHQSYLRFTLLGIVGCLLQFADEEFTRDSPESLARARNFYISALELLGADALQTATDSCGELAITILNALDRPGLIMLYGQILQPVISNGNHQEVERLTNEVIRIHETSEDDATRLDATRKLVEEATGSASELTYAELQGQRRQFRSRALELLSSTDGLGSPLAEIVARAGSSRGQPRVSPYVPRVNHSFCIPPNPVLDALRQHAEANLAKLRSCRNIAGLSRPVDAYAVSADADTGLARLGAGGRLVLPGPALRPTPYRFPVLLSRAKELANVAQQVETAYLSAMQARDGELYSSLKAQQDIELAYAGARLQELRAAQATGEVRLAQLQQDRARIQVDHYDDLIQEGLLASELAAVALLWAAAALHGAAAIASFSKPANALSSGAAAASTSASALSTHASYERRKQEWEFARRLSRQDVRIGAQQIRVAERGLDIAEHERDVAALQVTHAQTTADFLSNKDLNAELYSWMTGVLRGVYSFFLQQATATAMLAENQLSFERQEATTGYIMADYWKAPADDALASPSDDDSPELGLTGSSRLLQDIYRLDQHAFETRKRQLQLSRTFSLARLDPIAFQRFRETGLTVFETPSAIFDGEFPGHYVRLIRRVRTSVIALIPPTHGIRATLSNSGVSRVVTGGPIGPFGVQIVRRDPETISFTSPQDATGLFELAPDGEMLNPFEGNGVDTIWELRMPKASNPFDFSTIADVLVTIEYTALHSDDYRHQVIGQLDRSIGGDRAFSFRHELADQWYDLHNPERSATPMEVTFRTTLSDFPPNLQHARIRHVTLYFSAKEVLAPFEVNLHFEPKGAPGNFGGPAAHVEGLISTRRGNAGSWDMAGQAPEGLWTMAFPQTAASLFDGELVEDILLVVTFEGETPPWPS